MVRKILEIYIITIFDIPDFLNILCATYSETYLRIIGIYIASIFYNKGLNG